jgi:hypothetical protein
LYFSGHRTRFTKAVRQHILLGANDTVSYGLKALFLQIGTKKMANDNDIQQSMEALSLLPDRYYIILRSTGDGEFTLSAYDTTSKMYEDDEDFNSAMIIQEGVLDMIRMHTEEIYDRGVAAIQFRLVGQEMIEEAEITDPKAIKAVEGNVVKVDFGTKQ